MTALLGLSAGIHILVAPQHFREWIFAGVFFVAAAAAQSACAYAVSRTGSRRAVTAGAFVSFVLVSTWAISRVIGLPIGPTAGQPESVGAIDTVAGVAELAMIAASVLYLRRTRLVGAVARASRVGTAALAGFTILLGSATGNAMPRHEHSHPNSDLTSHRPHDTAQPSITVDSRSVGAGKEHDHSPDRDIPNEHVHAHD